MTMGLRYGAIELGVTSRFNWIWDDRGSKGKRDGAFYTPARSVLESLLGWRVLAHIGRPDHEHLDRQRTAILAREVDAANQMLKSPTDFERIWEDRASGAKAYGSCWRPVPPAGYVSLGDVFVQGWDKPDPRSYWCVRKTPVGGRSYVREGRIGASIYDDSGTGAHMDLSVWQIDPPSYPDDSTERLVLGLDAFVAGNQHHSRPNRTVYVLDLPALVVKRPEPTRPVLTSHSVPEQETLKVVDRAVTVPCTLVKDPGKEADWQVANSPFYTLERRVNYYRQLFYDNSGGSTEENNRQQVTTGISTESSEEYSRRTSITVSASVGISIKAFSASVETSVTTEMGYSSRYGVTQFQQETKDWSMTVPAGKSAALWSPRHEIVALRQNGEVVGGQGGLKCDVDVRVKTEFPEGSAVKVFVDDIEEAEDLKAQPFGESRSNVPERTPDIVTDTVTEIATD
ncbi:Vps62-related protein [Streptomyces sp. NPDC048111]|uniref:Vps62-related protein n=1 Tax=Streptomyces sp. NPDC048111 TaxID=3365500 RepID=UPI00371D741A